MSDLSFTLVPINGEPRIHDLQLGERLGFADARMIRKLIKSNSEKLKKFNVLYAEEKTSGERGGRPSTEYYLDRKQSIYVCMKSETDNAFDVQADIIHVYESYLDGKITPALPDFSDPAQAARAWADQYERSQALNRELEASRPKVAFHDQVVSSETLIDFPQGFSLLKQRTGQTFTSATFLAFLRRHGIACQPNPHANIGPRRFVPRKGYSGTWFVSQISSSGVVEWFLRPLAIAEIVRLIEEERTAPALAGTAMVACQGMR